MIIEAVRLVSKTGGASGDFGARRVKLTSPSTRPARRMLALASRACRPRPWRWPRRVGRVLAEDVAAVARPAAVRGLGHGRLGGARGRRAGTSADRRRERRGPRLSTARSAPGEAVRIFTGAAAAGRLRRHRDPGGRRARRRDASRVPAVAGRPLRPAGGRRLQGRRGRCWQRGVRIDPWRLSLAASAGRGGARGRRAGRAWRCSPPARRSSRRRPTPGPVPDLRLRRPGAGGDDRRAGAATAVRAEPVRDDSRRRSRPLRGADGDLVVTVGGASVGDHDLVQAGAQALGLELRGRERQCAAGQADLVRACWATGGGVLGLPGNPASAFVCAEMFLQPAPGRLCRARRPSRRRSPRGWPQALPANGSREHWMRAKLTYADGGVTGDGPTAIRTRRWSASSPRPTRCCGGWPARRPPRPASVVEVLPLVARIAQRHDLADHRDRRPPRAPCRRCRGRSARAAGRRRAPARPRRRSGASRSAIRRRAPSSAHVARRPRAGRRAGRRGRSPGRGWRWRWRSRDRRRWRRRPRPARRGCRRRRRSAAGATGPLGRTSVVSNSGLGAQLGDGQRGRVAADHDQPRRRLVAARRPAASGQGDRSCGALAGVAVADPDHRAGARHGRPAARRSAASSGATRSSKISIRAPQSSRMSGHGLPSP